MAGTPSVYGEEFDALAERWAIVQAEHDRDHPDRSQCGGVGGCSMMFAEVGLEHDMIDALETWRARYARKDTA